jgi:hypothetical protein
MRLAHALALVVWSAAALAFGPQGLGQQTFVAYLNPAGISGNQNFGGSLGMDFDVDYDILVTRLGCFDSLADGLQAPIVVKLFDRDSLEELAVLDFTSADAGELIGGSRFKDLPEPVELPSGFHGTIVAAGYNDAELNGNQGGVDLGMTTDSGGCVISFLGGSRFGAVASAGAFPDTMDGGPVNRYGAGTFVFERQDVPPAPNPGGGIAYDVAIDTLGNDSAVDAVGNDFNVRVDLRITSLGAFDSASDGFSGAITTRIYDRDSQSELASATFTPEDPGELVGGNRMKALAAPLLLPAGTRCAVIADGFSVSDQNGNIGFGPIDGLVTDNGGCAIEFVGRGRRGPAGAYPPAASIQVPNAAVQFVAGTFEFEPSPTPIERPRPPTNVQAAVQGGAIQLAWTAPVGGPAVAGYNIYQSQPPLQTKLNPTLVTATSFSVSNLLSGIQYCFVVRSVGANGIQGNPSSPPACAALTVTELPDETVVAYGVPAGTAGNQNFGGSLGMDFNVHVDSVVTRLGVFDSGSDGLLATITARLYERNSRSQIAALTFTPEDAGELVGGSRFKALEPPLLLPAGFVGTIVAEGYTAEEPVGNATVQPIPGLTTNGFDCAISFIGSRFGGAGAYPGTFQIAWAVNSFAAGTFEYGPVGEPGPSPDGGIAYVIAEGLRGNQAFGGALGMDFNVEKDIVITRLGVFDDSSDGLFLPINCRLYDRDTLEVLGSIDFSIEDPGDLEGGSRFKELEDPIGLPTGFRATIAASGYGAGEQNGNQGVGAIAGMSTDTGGCLITFVGAGRFGDQGNPLGYPNVVDGGPANRYAAGTFDFEESDTPIVRPPGVPRSFSVRSGSGEALLSWQPPLSATPAARYKVFRAPRGGAFQEVASVEGLEHRDGGLTNGQDYCYKLRSVAAAGQESDDTAAVCTTPGAVVAGRNVAYVVPSGTIGATPGIGEAFGLDFDVNLDVQVTRLGIFDSGPDGLASDLVVVLYDRNTQDPLRTVEFSSAQPGVIIGGSRFLDVPPLDLGAGFQGTIVAEGFNDGDPVFVGPNLDIDPGPCSLAFVGARRDPAGLFPQTAVAGAHPFAAGTFEFVAQDVAPPRDGGIAYINPVGTAGNQDFPGALGMDFNVVSPIRVTRFGVFDDSSDGLRLPLNARLYNRDTREQLARLEFTPEDPGEQVDGSWFKPLAAPIELPAGFHGTMAASGYGAAERNGNQGAFDLGLETDDAGCLLVFIGGGRFGNPATPDIFPDTVDGGPVNRYAAGTFEYERSEGGPTGVSFIRGDTNADGNVNIADASFLLNFLFLGGREPSCASTTDGNADGAGNIADASYILNFLFLGGRDIPPPNACRQEPLAEPVDCADYAPCRG